MIRFWKTMYCIAFSTHVDFLRSAAPPLTFPVSTAVD
jgi:hypothetical protein